MSNQFNHSKKWHADAVSGIELHVIRSRAASFWEINKKSRPAVFRYPRYAWQIQALFGQIRDLGELIGLKLKTRGLIADIMLNNLLAVSTGTRVFYRQFQLG